MSSATTLRRTLAVMLAALTVTSPASAQTAPSDYTAAVRYDAARRVTGTIAPDADGVAPFNYLATRNSYDVSGRLVAVESGALSNWPSQDVAPAAWGGFQVFQRVDTTYDVIGRKTTDTLSSGGTPYTLTQYSYDASGRLECTAVRMNPAVFGSLPASACTLGASGNQGPDRITRQVYDLAGQVLKVQKAVGTSLQQDYATYSYSLNGKQTVMIDANGNRAEMGWDGFDRQSRWTFPSKAAAGAVDASDYEAYGYDAGGNRTSLRKRDGQTIGYSYDALNRMTVKDIPGGTAADVYYGYDLQGLQTYARFTSASGVGITNVYDQFGRLRTATSNQGGTPRTIMTKFDDNGNLRRIVHPDGVSFVPISDQLDRITGIVDDYDVARVSISYDAQGQRAGVQRGGVTTSYGYDPVSRLASLTDDLPGTAADVTTAHAYNPASQVVTRTRSNGDYAFTNYVSVSRSYATNGLNQYVTAGSANFTYDANGNLTGDGTNGYSYDVENRLVGASNGTMLEWDPLGRLYRVSSATTDRRFVYDGDQLSVEYDAAGNILRRYVHGLGEDDPLLWYEGAGLNDPRTLQTDAQGSVVSVANAAGLLLGINRYDEYGIPGVGNLGTFQYTGQAWIPELGMYHYKARVYSPTLGRFLQTDPIGYADQTNIYAYVGNDPANRTDPSGEEQEDIVVTAKRFMSNINVWIQTPLTGHVRLPAPILSVTRTLGFSDKCSQSLDIGDCSNSEKFNALLYVAGGEFGGPVAVRVGYIGSVKALGSALKAALRAGIKPESVARAGVAARNGLKVAARSLSPKGEVAKMEARNLEKYGNKIGPTADQLYSKYGSWEAVVQAVARTAGFSW